MKPELFYYANLRVPSEKAHGIQIFNTCSSLLKYCSIKLIVPNRFNNRKENIWDFYNVSKFDIHKFNIVDELHPLIINIKPLRKFFYYLRISYSIFYLRFFILKKDSKIITREWWEFIILRRLNYHCIYEAHQIYTDQLSRKAILLGLRILGQNIKKSKLIVISRNLQLEFSKLGFIDISCIPDAAKENAYKKSKSFNKIKNVVYTGQLFKQKGIETLIESADSFPNLYFNIYGGSKNAVKRYKNHTNNKKNIFFHGRISPQEVLKVQANADLLVIPQVNELAQSPMKLFEYMASGTPILASGTNAITEIIKDNFNGNIFKAGCSESFIEKLNEIQTNYSDQSKIANQAYNDFMDNYTWSKRATKIKRFIYGK